jgi:hypothetical protein
MEENQAATAVDHYRPYYFSVLDHATAELKRRFETVAIAKYEKLENMLLSGKVDLEITRQYPELVEEQLAIELPMFKNQYNPESLEKAMLSFQGMVPEVQALFRQVERLIRLLLVCPASSCEAERSFSSLRRLKTWLRSTMTQTRLNAVAVCHTHKNYLDTLDLTVTAKEFVMRSQTRANLFGSFE